MFSFLGYYLGQKGYKVKFFDQPSQAQPTPVLPVLSEPTPPSSSPEDLKESCYNYQTAEGLKRYCATCGDGICEQGEECIASVCQENEEAGIVCGSDCGPLYCEQDCVCRKTGAESLYLSSAVRIAQASECVDQGKIKGSHFCNETTGTWWLDLEVDKPGCNPACVVNIETREAEINWRCTGLISD